MKDQPSIDYSPFDSPKSSSSCFIPVRSPAGDHHPRPSSRWISPPEKSVTIGGRFYAATPEAPVILFFHGNGEIVEDYDDIAEVFLRMGISFLPVDYRGYGRSSGSPSVTGMMRDCRLHL